MERSMTRRRALAALGGVSLGSALAACGNDDGKRATGSASTTTTGPPTTTSSPGALTGASSLADRFAQSATCSITPEETEGPFYFDVNSVRRDVREDRTGNTLRLGLRVVDPSCDPIPDAVVEIWHCDAAGVYSGFDSGAGETFLRGAQVTDTNGIAEFLTVYPGWYRGRTVHIHAKVHLDNRTALTTQLFFDDDFTATIFSQSPYPGNGDRDVFNNDDGIFDQRTLLTLSTEGQATLGLMTFGVSA